MSGAGTRIKLGDLTTVKLGALTDSMQRSAQLAYPRVSGLSDFLWRVIGWVTEREPLSINELAALLQRDVAQVSRAVKGLVTAGVLHRETRKGGPGVSITTTALGRTTYGTIQRLAAARNARMIRGLTGDQVRLLEACVAVMSRNAQAELQQEERRERRLNEDRVKPTR